MLKLNIFSALQIENKCDNKTTFFQKKRFFNLQAALKKKFQKTLILVIVIEVSRSLSLLEPLKLAKAKAMLLLILAYFSIAKVSIV